jgi:NADP-dependent 3-hydroxy acid dehydrogenase YdfG
MNHLDKAVTVITGASSGIGAATALALAERGARVALVARSDDKLQALVSKIRAAGGDAAAFKADVTNLEQVKAVVTAIEEQMGPVDILVNNAGLMLFSPWKDTEVADWDSMIDTNLRGYLHAIAAILPRMIVRSSGRILNMSSVAGIHVGDTAGVYGATKFFIRGITESLRKEVGVAHGIQVSMVSPGVIATGWQDRVKNAGGKQLAEALSKDGIPPETIADAVVYALDQPPGVSVGEVIVHPTKQDW